MPIALGPWVLNAPSTQVTGYTQVPRSFLSPARSSTPNSPGLCPRHLWVLWGAELGCTWVSLCPTTWPSTPTSPESFSDRLKNPRSFMSPARSFLSPDFLDLPGHFTRGTNQVSPVAPRVSPAPCRCFPVLSFLALDRWPWVVRTLLENPRSFCPRPGLFCPRPGLFYPRTFWTSPTTLPPETYQLFQWYPMDCRTP
jgi:hypothetical protein